MKVGVAFGGEPFASQPFLEHPSPESCPLFFYHDCLGRIGLALAAWLVAFLVQDDHLTATASVIHKATGVSAQETAFLLRTPGFLVLGGSLNRSWMDYRARSEGHLADLAVHMRWLRRLAVGHTRLAVLGEFEAHSLVEASDSCRLEPCHPGEAHLEDTHPAPAEDIRHVLCNWLEAALSS